MATKSDVPEPQPKEPPKVIAMSLDLDWVELLPKGATFELSFPPIVPLVLTPKK